MGIIVLDTHNIGKEELCEKRIHVKRKSTNLKKNINYIETNNKGKRQLFLICAYKNRSPE